MHFHLSVRLGVRDTVVDRHGVAVFVDEVVVIIVYMIMMHVDYELNIKHRGRGVEGRTIDDGLGEVHQILFISIDERGRIFQYSEGGRDARDGRN